MRLSTVFLLAVLSFHGVVAQTYTVQSVPNARLINKSYVSNPDHLIRESTVAEINQLLDSLEQNSTAQVAVVILNSIGDADVFEFAQELFKMWGIGQAQNDNGLLILYVQDKRTIRFHTGYGLEGVMPDAICKRIQTQKMVPRFKEGDLDGGMLAGVQEVNTILTNPSYSDEIQAADTTLTETDQQVIREALSILLIFGWFFIGLIIFFVKRKRGFSNSRLAPKEVPSAAISSWQWLLLVYFLPMVLAWMLPYFQRWDVYVGSLYGYVGVLSLGKYTRVISRANQWLAKGHHQTVYSFLKDNQKWIGLAVFYPIPFAFLVRPYKKKMENVRMYPRDCHHCGKKMIRLNEAMEDEHLGKELQFEEELKSVDYDVWKCVDCKSVSVERYVNEKTQYTACVKCKTLAQFVESTSILSHATTSSSGEEEIIEVCKYCGNRHRTTKTIPMISTSSDDSSSSSSSSSDSGGSWGGGDSGGGGASSSW
ncbi:MAG: TPM domain-containing protein [Cyclobacteriaceae bacterium]|nr:TPM domain-containing protein [Cyclobacteriaceae bacterium]